MSSGREIKQEWQLLCDFIEKESEGKITAEEVSSRLSKHPDPSFVIKHMEPFINGFGQIEHDDGLLTFAQIAARKKYVFNPTLITKDELSDYLMMLKNDYTRPVRERFVISGMHWVSADIDIDQAGKVKILIIDSLGGQCDPDFLGTVKGVFSGHSISVYFDATKRQNSEKGCSVFALDDVRHLFTAEQYLKDEGSNPIKLFEYLEHSRGEEKTTGTGAEEKALKTDIAVSATHLPLSLMRTMQSDSLVRSVIEKRSDSEKKRPVNKKGRTAIEEAERDFQGSKTTDKKVNTRLKRKLGRFAVENFKFLLEIQTEEELKAKTNKHSLLFKKINPVMADLDKGIESKQEGDILKAIRNEYDLVYVCLKYPELIRKDFIGLLNTKGFNLVNNLTLVNAISYLPQECSFSLISLLNEGVIKKNTTGVKALAVMLRVLPEARWPDFLEASKDSLTKPLSDEDFSVVSSPDVFSVFYPYLLSDKKMVFLKKLYDCDLLSPSMVSVVIILNENKFPLDDNTFKLLQRSETEIFKIRLYFIRMSAVNCLNQKSIQLLLELSRDGKLFLKNPPELSVIFKEIINSNISHANLENVLINLGLLISPLNDVKKVLDVLKFLGDKQIIHYALSVLPMAQQVGFLRESKLDLTTIYRDEQDLLNSCHDLPRVTQQNVVRQYEELVQAKQTGQKFGTFFADSTQVDNQDDPENPNRPQLR